MTFDSGPFPHWHTFCLACGDCIICGGDCPEDEAGVHQDPNTAGRFRTDPIWTDINGRPTPT